MANEDTFGALVEAVSGAAGGFFSAGSLYPLEVAKLQIQSAKKSSSDPLAPAPTLRSTLERIYSNGGVGALYSGWYFSAGQSASEKFIHYYFYESLRRLYEEKFGAMGPTANVVVGYVSEWMHLPFTMPVEVTSTVYQSNIGQANQISWLATLVGLWRSGWRGLYKGLGAYAGLNLKPAIQDAAFDQIKAAYLAGAAHRRLSDLQVFFLGVVARCIATAIVFPAQKAKVLAIAAAQDAARAKERGGDEAGETSSAAPPAGTLACIAYTLRHGGPGALYAGLGPELYRGMLSAGLMYLTKERIKRLIVRLMYGLAGRKHLATG